MILYRIVKSKYADDLSGTGARLFGGRWNSEGQSAIYLASSRALAVLEVLVHLVPLSIPSNYFVVEVEVPDNSFLQISIKDLPNNWDNNYPPPSLKKIGDDFLKKGTHLMMKVPSAIVPMEYNYLVNTEHPDMKKVKISRKEPFHFDKRLYNN